MMTKMVFDAETGESTEVELTEEELAEYVARVAEFEAGEPDRRRAEIVGLVERQLDEFARTRGYDNMLSACTYATSKNEKFAREGQYCVELRDATWGKLEEFFAAGELNYPVVKKGLPKAKWP